MVHCIIAAVSLLIFMAVFVHSVESSRSPHSLKLDLMQPSYAFALNLASQSLQFPLSHAAIREIGILIHKESLQREASKRQSATVGDEPPSSAPACTSTSSLGCQRTVGEWSYGSFFNIDVTATAKFVAKELLHKIKQS